MPVSSGPTCYGSQRGLLHRRDVDRTCRICWRDRGDSEAWRRVLRVAAQSTLLRWCDHARGGDGTSGQMPSGPWGTAGIELFIPVGMMPPECCTWRSALGLLACERLSFQMAALAASAAAGENGSQLADVQPNRGVRAHGVASLRPPATTPVTMYRGCSSTRSPAGGAGAEMALIAGAGCGGERPANSNRGANAIMASLSMDLLWFRWAGCPSLSDRLQMLGKNHKWWRCRTVALIEVVMRKGSRTSAATRRAARLGW